MKDKISDTDPEAEKVLIELSRNATVAEKFAIVCSLSQTVIQLSRQDIIKANKGISDRDVDVFFVKLHYGPELANGLSEYLERHDHLH